ncbi:hypothetical protein ACOSQ3_019759 [Xanthoceras sorbifolium]
MWRACRNWLPSQCTLARRGMRIEVGCRLCDGRPETPVHVVWGCPSLKHIRRSCGFLNSFPAWQPLPTGVVKLNVDAVLCEARGLVGIGFVLRDEEGQVFGSSWQQFGGGLSPVAAEAAAMVTGLRFALDVGVTSIVLESKSSSLVGLVLG